MIEAPTTANVNIDDPFDCLPPTTPAPPRDPSPYQVMLAEAGQVFGNADDALFNLQGHLCAGAAMMTSSGIDEPIDPEGELTTLQKVLGTLPTGALINDIAELRQRLSDILRRLKVRR